MKKTIKKYQLGNSIPIGPSINNYQVSDRRFTQPDGNILSNFLYNYLPNNEFGTGFHYYTDLPKYDQFLHAVENIPGLLKKRKDQLNRLQKGYVSSEEKVIDDLYKEYVGKKSKLQDYRGQLPESLKNEKIIKTLPKDLENIIYEDAMEAFAVTDKKFLDVKDGFYKIPLENIELGNFTAYVNPKTKELRYYDKYDLDQIPFADNIANPYTIYNRVKKSDYIPTEKKEEYTNNIKKAKIDSPLTKQGNIEKMKDFKTHLQLAESFGIVTAKDQLPYWNEDDSKRNLVKKNREKTNEYQNGGEIQKNFMKKTNKYQKGAYIPQKQFGGAFDSINNTMNTWKGFWNSPGFNYFDFFGNGVGGIQNIAAHNVDVLNRYNSSNTALSDFYKNSTTIKNATQGDKLYDRYHENLTNGIFDVNSGLGAELVNYQNAKTNVQSAKTHLGTAFTNTAAGIMTGMQYLGSYSPEEKINTSRGFQGVKYAETGGPVMMNNIYEPQNRPPLILGGPQQGMNMPSEFTIGQPQPTVAQAASIPTANTTVKTTTSKAAKPNLTKDYQQTEDRIIKAGTNNNDPWEYKQDENGEWLARDTKRNTEWFKAKGEALTAIQKKFGQGASNVKNLQSKVSYPGNPQLSNAINNNPQSEQQVLKQAQGFPNSKTYKRGDRKGYQFLAKRIEDWDDPTRDYQIVNPTTNNTYTDLSFQNVLRTRLNMGSITPYEAKRLQKLAEKKGYYTPKKQYGGYQMGGDINLTGFTPNTPTMNNKYNIIPGDTQVMHNTPHDVVGIGSNGFIQLMKANSQEPYKFWGSKQTLELPSYQYGGQINNPNSSFSTAILPSLMKDNLEHIQTEKGEVVFMPDGSVVDVKADKKHKQMKKNHVTDILPSGYVFSHDPKMKLSRKSSIQGIKLDDMNLGKTAFEYKENEITKGPEDIKLAPIFFGNSKKELTTADIAKNIKKNLPLVDLKGDWFADTANEENKSQRVEYLTILKAFNEFKKPNKKRTPPPQQIQQMQQPEQYEQAQYGMQTTPQTNYFDKGMNFMSNAGNPFARVDNNTVSRFSANQRKFNGNNNFMFQYGGDIKHASLGSILRYTSPVFFIGSELDAYFKKRKQKKENAAQRAEFTGLQDKYKTGMKNATSMDVGTNLASYMASLNVPLQKYDNMQSAESLASESFRKQRMMLDVNKRNAGNFGATGSSMARHMNPASMGSYLASLDNGSKDIVSRVQDSIANLEANRANTIGNLRTQGTANRNNAFNTRDAQMYNANVTGIGNVGRSMSTKMGTDSQLDYDLGMERMAFDQMQSDKLRAVRDRVINKWESAAGTVGQLALSAATGGFGGIGGGIVGGIVGGGIGGGATNTSTASATNINPYGFDGNRGYDMSNFSSNPYGFNSNPYNYNGVPLLDTNPYGFNPSNRTGNHPSYSYQPASPTWSSIYDVEALPRTQINSPYSYGTKPSFNFTSNMIPSNQEWFY